MTNVAYSPDNPRNWRADDPALYPAVTPSPMPGVPHETAGLVRAAMGGNGKDVLIPMFKLTPNRLRMIQEQGLGTRQRAERLGQPIHEPRYQEPQPA